MVFGFVVSLFAILQHLSSNGEIYWFREVRSGVEPFGPYVNRNHFAGFAELILPLALVPILRSEEHTSELQSLTNLVCRLLLEKKKQTVIQLNYQLTNL